MAENLVIVESPAKAKTISSPAITVPVIKSKVDDDLTENQIDRINLSADIADKRAAVGKFDALYIVEGAGHGGTDIKPARAPPDNGHARQCGHRRDHDQGKLQAATHLRPCLGRDCDRRNTLAKHRCGRLARMADLH